MGILQRVFGRRRSHSVVQAPALGVSAEPDLAKYRARASNGEVVAVRCDGPEVAALSGRVFLRAWSREKVEFAVEMGSHYTVHGLSANGQEVWSNEWGERGGEVSVPIWPWQGQTAVVRLLERGSDWYIVSVAAEGN
jgi:hypothetical protein